MKTPYAGEVVNTPFGKGVVVEVRHWPEMENEFNSVKEKEAFVNRVVHFLGSVDKYFDFTVRYCDEYGVFEYEILDWSEYNRTS